MLCEPPAMASVFRSLTISQSSSSSSYNQPVRYSTPFYQKPSHLKLHDISVFSNSSSCVLVARPHLASAATTTTTTTTRDKSHEGLNSSTDDSLGALDMTPLCSENDADAPRTRTLSKRYTHLLELFSQLSAGVDVPSAMDPWLQRLSLYDWNQLLVECGYKDRKISMQIMDFFREKEALLDQTVLFPQNNEEATLDSSAETSQEPSEGSNGGSSEETLEAILEAPKETILQSGEEMVAFLTEVPSESLDMSTSSDQEEAQQSSGNIIPSLKLYTTLVSLLGRRRLFEEVDRVQLQMKEAGIEPNVQFYNVLLDCHVEKRSFATAFEILQEMKCAGFEPHHYIYDKLAYIYMNQENPDMDILKELAEDLKGRSLPVCIAIYKRLLRAYWEAKDVVGAEEAFEAMLAAGYTPELKVLLKVMQLNGRRGKHERVVELLELMAKLGMKPNASAYDYLVHAYCKSALLEKAEETLLKYESVLGMKPTTIALNMLIDGYGKQGLYEEAFKTFEQIKGFGYRPTEVSYSSIISAMAQVGKFNSAAQLYGRMLKEGIRPNLHTYLTLIRSYTKCNQTREGHKIYNAMRKAPFQMTQAAYSASLALYVDGNWYHHAAALLREVEEKGEVLDAAAHSALIRSFGFLESKATPLVKAVQESKLEICKVLSALFHTTSASEKLEPELIEAVFSLLEEWKEVVSLEAKALVYNAFMDYFWRKGYKGMARKILHLGREVYVGYSKPRLNETESYDFEWVLDVRGLGVGGAKIALTDCLIDVEEVSKERRGDDWKMVIVTGDEFSLGLPQDNRAVKRAIKVMLAELGSPFVVSQESSERMESSLANTLKWLSQQKVKEALSSTDSY